MNMKSTFSKKYSNENTTKIDYYMNKKTHQSDIFAKEKINPLDCIVHVEMRSLWKTLRLMGALPYTEVRKRGDVAFHWRSTAMLYSAVINIILSYVAIDIITFRINVIQLKKSHFDSYILQILLILLEAPCLFVPVTFWLNTKHFVEFIQNFAKFETDYYRICRTKLNIKTRKYCTACTILILFYVIISGPLTVLGLNSANNIWYYTICYLHVIYLITLSLSYFRFLTFILRKVSEELQKNLSNVLKTSTKSSVIQDYRLLHFHLLKLSKDVTEIFKSAFILYSLVVISCLTFATNAMITATINGTMRRSGRNLSIIVVLYLVIYFIINMSQSLEDSVRKAFNSNFLRSRKSTNYYGKDMAAQIKIFIKMLKISGTDLTSIGYFGTNHKTLISLMSLMSTYIIIMVQFRISHIKIIPNDGNDADLGRPEVFKSDT